MLKAKDLMTTNVLSAEAHTPFSKVVRVFVEMGFHHVPIVDEEGNLMAMMSSTDALKAMHETDEIARKYEGYSLERRLNVRSEMTKDVITILADSSVSDVINKMVVNKIHALPVVEGDKIIGIISSNDILDAINNGKLKVKMEEEKTIFY